MEFTVPTHAKELQLVSRPKGTMTLDQLAEVEVPVGEPEEGQVLVRNEWMLLSVVLRELMEAEPNPDLPMPTYELGEAPWSPTVGTVVKSRSSEYAVGDLVFHNFGFRQYAVSGTSEWELSKLDRSRLPDSKYHLLQSPGGTAWRGLVTLGQVEEGDVVFIAGASSGVGSVAGQIAKCRGAAKVIGSVGSKEKAEFLVNELGFDAAFDYHDGPVADRLAELAPDGINLIFDNVGGEQFEAAVANAATSARVILCGTLSKQNPVLDHENAIVKDLTIRGFISDYGAGELESFIEAYSGWVAEGTWAFAPTIVDGGLSAIPQALIDQVEGKGRGVVLVGLND